MLTNFFQSFFQSISDAPCFDQEDTSCMEAINLVGSTAMTVFLGMALLLTIVFILIAALPKYSFKSKIFSDILDKIKNYNNCYFIELKLQKKNGNKKKFNKIDDFNKKDFDKFYKDIDIIKIDLIFFTDYEFIEVSIIYNFSTDITSKEEYIKNINKDITELKDEGNYYKVLKRLFSIYKLNNDKPKLLYLSKIFNSVLGKQYKKISNLNTILLLLDYYKDDNILKKVEINLKGIKEPTSIKDIRNNQDKYYNKLNEEAKYYYDELTKKSKPNLQYA